MPDPNGPPIVTPFISAATEPGSLLSTRSNSRAARRSIYTIRGKLGEGIYFLMIRFGPAAAWIDIGPDVHDQKSKVGSGRRPRLSKRLEGGSGLDKNTVDPGVV